MHFPWVAALAAAPLSALVLVILHLAHRRLPQDEPNARSLHRHPVPRVGGIAIWAGFLPSVVLASGSDASWRVWCGAWLAIAAVSLIDDWRGVRPELRLAVQAVAAAAVTVEFLGSRLTQGFGPGAAATGLAVVVALMWAANLYNFMDGSDGLAALMAICGFGAYAAAATISGRAPELYFALAAAAVPFLAVNLPPARAFMGDVGSVPLGFLAGAFGLAGIVDNAWPGWFPPLVFLPFIADATLTLLRRLARRERVFEAHRTHYYQRLHQMGAGHRGTLVFYAVLIVGTTSSALFTLAQGRAAGWAVLTGWAVAIGIAFAGIDYHWRKRIPSR